MAASTLSNDQNTMAEKARQIYARLRDRIEVPENIGK